jgi:hypothetical protein
MYLNKEQNDHRLSPVPVPAIGDLLEPVRAMPAVFSLNSTFSVFVWNARNQVNDPVDI